MSLKSLMQDLKNRSTVTPVTLEKSTGLQPEPAWIVACTLVTPVTPHFSDTHATTQAGQFGEAVNDPASTKSGALENLKKSAIPAAESDPVQALGLVINSPVTSQTPVHTEPAAPPVYSDGWRVLADAYYAHHFNCPICIAAGRGTSYGLRCGTGAALWMPYNAASESKTL